MKLFQLLIGLALFAALGFCADEIAPSTLPSKGPKWYGGQDIGSTNWVETRVFHVRTKDYMAVLSHGDIAGSPEWKPSLELPTSLGKIEEIARAELHKAGTDSAEWETSSIQLNRVEQSIESKWYYAVSFTPVLKVRSLRSDDSMVVLLTLDGKPGHRALYKGTR